MWCGIAFIKKTFRRTSKYSTAILRCYSACGQCNVSLVAEGLFDCNFFINLALLASVWASDSERGRNRICLVDRVCSKTGTASLQSNLTWGLYQSHEIAFHHPRFCPTFVNFACGEPQESFDNIRTEDILRYSVYEVAVEKKFG